MTVSKNWLPDLPKLPKPPKAGEEFDVSPPPSLHWDSEAGEGSTATSFWSALEVMRGDYCKIKAEESVLQQHRDQWHSLVDSWLHQVTYVLDTMAQSDISFDAYQPAGHSKTRNADDRQASWERPAARWSQPEAALEWVVPAESEGEQLVSVRTLPDQEEQKKQRTHPKLSIATDELEQNLESIPSGMVIEAKTGRDLDPHFESLRQSQRSTTSSDTTSLTKKSTTTSTRDRLAGQEHNKKQSVSFSSGAAGVQAPQAAENGACGTASTASTPTNALTPLSAGSRHSPSNVRISLPAKVLAMKSVLFKTSKRSNDSADSASNGIHLNGGNAGAMPKWIGLSPKVAAAAARVQDNQNASVVTDAKKASLANKLAGKSREFMDFEGSGRCKRIQWRCRQIVEHPCFDVASCLLIVFSTAINAAEVEAAAVSGPQTLHDFPYGTITNIVALGFLFEVSLRMVAHRMYFFIGHDWSWNLFDLSLVLCGLVELMVSLTNQDEGFIDATSQRALRAVRVIRNLRIIRALRFFYELRQMLHAVFGSMRTLLWLGVLLSMLLYFFALCFTSAVTDYLNDPVEAVSGECCAGMQTDVPDKRLLNDKIRKLIDRKILQEEYGSILLSFLSLFKAITNGVSWGLVMEPWRRVGYVYVMLYLGFIMFSIFAFTNVVTSVFVDSAMRASQSQQDQRIGKELEKKQELVKNLEAIFYEVDLDGSGQISTEELDFFLADDRAQAYFSALGLDSSDARSLFTLFDGDASGTVDIDEFVQGCMRLKGEATSLQQHEMKQTTDRILRRLTRFMSYVHGEFDRIAESQGIERRSLRLSQGQGTDEENRKRRMSRVRNRLVSVIDNEWQQAVAEGKRSRRGPSQATATWQTAASSM